MRQLPRPAWDDDRLDLTPRELARVVCMTLLLLAFFVVVLFAIALAGPA